MKFLQDVADTIVQTVRDYPKGFIILAVVLIVIARIA